jgi:hypothetical protein
MTQPLTLISYYDAWHSKNKFEIVKTANLEAWKDDPLKKNLVVLATGTRMAIVGGLEAAIKRYTSRKAPRDINGTRTH